MTDLFGDTIAPAAQPRPTARRAAAPHRPTAVPDPVRPPAENQPLDGRWQIVRLNMAREYESELAGPLYDYENLRAGLRGSVGYLTDAETLAVCQMIREYFSCNCAAEPHQKGNDERSDEYE